MSDASDKRCRNCGAEVIGDWGESEEDKTPVDPRQERFAQANEVLREAAMEALESANRDLERDHARLQRQLTATEAVTEHLRNENAKLKLALKSALKQGGK